MHFNECGIKLQINKSTAIAFIIISIIVIITVTDCRISS